MLRSVPGVLDAGQVRLRWIGHQLRADPQAAKDIDYHAELSSHR
jgi:hypothetical protein